MVTIIKSYNTEKNKEQQKSMITGNNYSQVLEETWKFVQSFAMNDSRLRMDILTSVSFARTSARIVTFNWNTKCDITIAFANVLASRAKPNSQSFYPAVGSHHNTMYLLQNSRRGHLPSITLLWRGQMYSGSHYRFVSYACTKRQ